MESSTPTFQPAVKGFKSVTDFAGSRSWLSALGFYAFHFAIGILLCEVAALIFVGGGATTQEVLAKGAVVGQRVAVVYTVFVYIKIIMARKMSKNLWYYLNLVVSLVLSLIGGLLFGLIPAAVTLAQKSNEQKGYQSYFRRHPNENNDFNIIGVLLAIFLVATIAMALFKFVKWAWS